MRKPDEYPSLFRYSPIDISSSPGDRGRSSTRRAHTLKRRTSYIMRHISGSTSRRGWQNMVARFFPAHSKAPPSRDTLKVISVGSIRIPASLSWSPGPDRPAVSHERRRDWRDVSDGGYRRRKCRKLGYVSGLHTIYADSVRMATFKSATTHTNPLI